MNKIGLFAFVFVVLATGLMAEEYSLSREMTADYTYVTYYESGDVDNFIRMKSIAFSPIYSGIKPYVGKEITTDDFIGISLLRENENGVNDIFLIHSLTPDSSVMGFSEYPSDLRFSIEQGDVKISHEQLFFTMPAPHLADEERSLNEDDYYVPYRFRIPAEVGFSLYRPFVILVQDGSGNSVELSCDLHKLDDEYVLDIEGASRLNLTSR